MNLRGDAAHPIIAPLPALYDLEYADPKPVWPLTLYVVCDWPLFRQGEAVSLASLSCAPIS